MGTCVSSRKHGTLRVSLALAVMAFATSMALADAWHVRINLAAVSSPDLQIEFAIYDNSGVRGDSYAHIDNVRFWSDLENFEAGDLGGFDDSLNAAAVSPLAGSLDGFGQYVMAMNEDALVSPAIAFRTFTGSPGGGALHFDFEYTTTGAKGALGLDQFVVSILDPATLSPLLPGLTVGMGDVLAVDGMGMTSTDAVTVLPIPEPGTVVFLAVSVLMWFASGRRRH